MLLSCIEPLPNAGLGHCSVGTSRWRSDHFVKQVRSMSLWKLQQSWSEFFTLTNNFVFRRRITNDLCTTFQWLSKIVGGIFMKSSGKFCASLWFLFVVLVCSFLSLVASTKLNHALLANNLTTSQEHWPAIQSVKRPVEKTPGAWDETCICMLICFHVHVHT